MLSYPTLLVVAFLLMASPRTQKSSSLPSLSLLGIPHLETTRLYQEHLRSTINTVANELLDQPDSQQALVEKKCFVGERQDKLDDVLSTIDIFPVCFVSC